MKIIKLKSDAGYSIIFVKKPWLVHYTYFNNYQFFPP